MFVFSHPVGSALVWLILIGTAMVNSGCKKDARSVYQYTVPQKTNDGWNTGSIATQNIDPALLGKLFERIRDQTYKNVHSVLLVKNGRLVVEEYFHGTNSDGDFRPYDRNSTHELASVTKSVTPF
jgi:CubicO group peptidase (beta-lactamase class C family)